MISGAMPRDEGGQDIQRLCPIDIMPVFIKAGTILPFGPEVQYQFREALG